MVITPQRFGPDPLRDELFIRCPKLRFYLAGFIEAYVRDTESARTQIARRWESSAPRPIQRNDVLSAGNEDDGNPDPSIIAFGKISGSGKTTACYERLWGKCVSEDTGKIYSPNDELPLAWTGHEFARKIASNARDLDSVIQPLLRADYLLLDDVDKRSNSDGQMSRIVQESFLEVIETRSTTDKPTLLTMNSTGEEFGIRFDDDLRPYVIRRLRKRFQAINFDPQPAVENIVLLERTA